MSNQDPTPSHEEQQYIKSGEASAAQINISINDQEPREDPRANRSQHESGADEQEVQRSRTPSAINASRQSNDGREDDQLQSQQQQQQRVTFDSKSGQADYYRSDYRRPIEGESRPPVHDYRRSVSPHLQQEYEKTQRVLDQVRARSREQQYLHPAGGNGYERHNGSPQRYSPKRSAERQPQPQPHWERPAHVPLQHASLQSSIVQSQRRSSRSPLQETHNMRSSIQTRDEGSNFKQSQYQHEIRQNAQQTESIQRIPVHQNTVSNGKENNYERGSSQQFVRQGSCSATRLIEHSRTVTSHSGVQVSIRSSEMIHDQIIASYRKQLQNSANLDSLYEQLKLRIHEVAQRKGALDDSIRYMRQDYEKQIEQQTHDSELLQQELEDMKRANADLAHQGSQVTGDIMDAKASLNQKEIEIQRIRNDITRSQDEGRFVRDAIDDQKRLLSQSYQTKDHQNQKIFQLTAQLKNQEQSNFVSTSSSNQKTTELNNLREQQRRLEDTLHHKSVQMDDASTKYEIARAELSRNQTETAALQKDCENANHRNTFLLETQRGLIRQKETEGNRSTELNTGVAACEGKYLHLDSELQGLSRELEAIRKSNESQLEAGHCFKQELHALQNHADLLAMQNNDLQKELDEFVMTDEIIRTGLDRKTRVSVMKERLQKDERDSIHYLEKSKSPCRSRSPLQSMTNQMQMQGAGSTLTQQYLNYHRHADSQGGAMTNQVSMQDLCKQQLEENIARERQTQQQASHQSFNIRSHQGRDADNMSPVQYRARNGSPLRKA